MSWKTLLFRLLGKDPEAVVVSFLSGPEPLARKMIEEVRALVPDREHFAVSVESIEIPGIRVVRLDELPGPLRRKRIGLAPVLLNNDARYAPLRRMALRMVPHKLLAYNERLERHHLRVTTPIASFLFVGGVPLDRIWLRPRWLWPWRRDRTELPDSYQVLEGRPLRSGRPRVGVLTPYFPYPLSHGGAVRIFNLLREASRDFDLFLFSFVEGTVEAGPVLEFCSKVITVPLPRYREPRWSTLHPPEAGEFEAPIMRKAIADVRAEHRISLLQVEYTHMAKYGGDVLVEHDVTFDLYDQVLQKEKSWTARYNLWRWRRFETRAVEKFRRVVVMSEKDAELLGIPHAVVIPNGVDLSRFRSEPGAVSNNVLFVGSFRHFPNLTAFRFLAEQVWPRVMAECPWAHATVIAGPHPERYWSDALPNGMELHGFIADVHPFYVQSTVVVVPTRVSAGTNLKVLEAMAMERPIVSTTSGCAGIGLQDGVDVLIADDPEAFATAIVSLLHDPELRTTLAERAKKLAHDRYDWRSIGVRQKRLWTELLDRQPIRLRTGGIRDLDRITEIQGTSHLGANWEPSTYLSYDLRIAERNGVVAGFMVSRAIDPEEVEILNLAVHPEYRRQGIAAALINSIAEPHVFLEVRESNETAIATYLRLGFTEVGRRNDYYDDPPEHAIVMRRSRDATY